MASNSVQRGDVVTVTAPSGGVVSGALVVVGRIVGVAMTTAAQGDPVEVATQGVFTLVKGATVTSPGGPVYHSSGTVTPTASTNKEVGIALQAKGLGEFTVDVVLVPSVRASVAA